MRRYTFTFRKGERRGGRITVFADSLGAAFARLTTDPERGMGEWDHIDIAQREVDLAAMEYASAELVAMQRPFTAEEVAYGQELATRLGLVKDG